MQRLALGVFVSALAFATPNFAAAEESRQVDLSGVDLNSDAGAEHALRRLENAAEAVCGVRTGMQPNSERRAALACAREAVADAVNDLGSARVSARFEQTRQFAQLGRRG
jgi:UrcA family protein